MEAKQTFTILFWLNKSREKNGKAPISCRVTINGQRAEISTNRKVSAAEWNPVAQKVISKTQEAKEINNYLATIKARLLTCHSKLEARNEHLTAETLKREFSGITERPSMLMEIFTQHNYEIKTLIGKTYTQGTWKKYETTRKHVEDFLKWKFKITDIDLKNLGFEFITDFEFYLKSQKNVGPNTSAKYIKNFKKIILECVAKNWLQKDPFMGYKAKGRKTERDFLTNAELKQILEARNDVLLRHLIHYIKLNA